MLKLVNGEGDWRRVGFMLVIVISIFVSYYVFIGNREFVFQGINVSVPWFVFPFILSFPLLIPLFIELYHVLIRVFSKPFSFMLRGSKVNINVDSNKVSRNDSFGSDNKNVVSSLVQSSQTVVQANVQVESDKSKVNDVKNDKGVQNETQQSNAQSMKSSEVSIADEKIKELEMQVKSLHDELKGFKDDTLQNVQEIRDAIINLRSTISEIDNPFNFMKKYAEVFGIESLEKLEQGKAVTSVKNDSSSKSIESSEKVSSVGSISSDKVVVSDDRGKVSNERVNDRNKVISVGLSSDVAHIVESAIEPERIIYMVILVNKILSAFGKDYTLSVLDFYHSVGFIDDKVYNAMIKALDLVEKSKRIGIGITVKDQVIMMIDFMKMLGFDKKYSNFINIVELLLKDISGGGSNG